MLKKKYRICISLETVVMLEDNIGEEDFVDGDEIMHRTELRGEIEEAVADYDHIMGGSSSG